ncbi:MAG: hypothetical protein KAH22_08945 [Thiotrichaceae bacterium]|nr:hypothetical protein [Thiotrichaceae bacterium]
MKLHKIKQITTQLYHKVDPEKRRERQAFEDLRHRYYNDFWQNACSQIGAEIEPLGDGFLRITRSKQWTVVRQYNVMLDNQLTLNMAGNKTIMQGLLETLDCPVPKTFNFTIDALDSALAYQQQRNKKLVVKPKGGSGGQGVTVNIETAEQLVKAIKNAALIDSELLIEDHIEGASFRLLYLHGQFIDAVRRDPPLLIGNGKDSIKQLIQQENIQRLQSELVTALSPLKITEECRLSLARQQFKLSDVMPQGRAFEVMKVVNWNAAPQNHIVREQVHPEIIAMGQNAVQQLRVELAGVDIMAQDISSPLDQNNGVINEINTTPGLHHHDLVAERDQRIQVGALLLETLLK